MNRILIFFILVVTTLLLMLYQSPVSAHLGIMYVPQISVNTIHEVENTIIDFTTPQNIKLAISKVEKPFIAGESITFNALETNSSTNKNELIYQWNFQDNTPIQEGIRINHIFKKPGTYTVELKKGLKDKTSMQVVDTLKIDIIPISGYSLPHADFVANGKPIVKGFINFTELNNTKIVFEASDSSSINDIKKYMWDFSDGQYAEGKTVNYSYKGKSNSVSAILRVIDKNDVMDEIYSIISFKDLPASVAVEHNTSENTNSIVKLIIKILNFLRLYK